MEELKTEPLPTNQCLVHRDYAIVDNFVGHYKLDNLDSLLAKYPTFLDGNLVQSILTDDPNYQADIAVFRGKPPITYQMFKSLLAIQTRDHETLLKINQLLQQQKQNTRDALEKAEAALERGDKKEEQRARQDAQEARAEAERLSNLYFPANQPSGNRPPSVVETIDRRRLPLLEIGKQLVAALASALYNELIATCNAAPDDPVLVARLFYSWIAHSFWWQWARATDLEEQTGGAPNQQPASTIARGFQVCLGFGELFADMFNAVMITDARLRKYGPNIRARTIIGNVRTKRRVPDPKSTEEGGENAHAWSAFPLTSNGVGEVTSWKVIDTCWARIQDAKDSKTMIHFDPTWFTRSNAAILLDHFPEPKKYPNTYKLVQYVAEAQQIDENTFWARDLPVLNPLLVSKYQIDMASVIPEQAIINAVTQISFKRSCEHVDSLTYPHPNFWLRLSGKNSVGVTFTAEVPFAQRPNACYTAAVNTSLPNANGLATAQLVVPLVKATGALFTGAPPSDMGALDFDTIVEWQIGRQ
jgi:hypothetical protein